MPRLPLPPPLSDPATGAALRPLRAGDAPLVAAALGLSPRGARRYLGALARERAAGRWLALAVAERGRDESVGHVALHSFAWEERRAEVAYWVAPGARGRGLGGGALRLLAGWALGPGALGLHRLEARTEPGDDAAAATARAAGFAARDGSQLLVRSDLP